MSKDLAKVTLSGMVTRSILHRPGQILRFTLAGSVIHPVERDRELIYYQDVMVPGTRADELAPRLREGGSYLVQGNLVSKSKAGQPMEWKVVSFDLTPVHRQALVESAGGHKRLEDAISHASILGNLTRDPKVVENERGVMVRLSIGVRDRQASNLIQVKVDESELASSLREARQGDRIFVMGPLYTERYTSGEATIRQTTVVATHLEFIGEVTDEGPDQGQDQGQDHSEDQATAERSLDTDGGED